MAKDGTNRGRRKGSKNKATINKEQAREALRLQITAALGPMTEAQIANAQGIKYLVARERKTGKFTKLTEAQAMLKLGQQSDTEVIEVWEERPNVSAYTDLLNRALDKPKEQAMEVDLTITQLDQLIRAARERVSGS